MQTQSRLSSGGSNLVRVGAEEQREQRDHSDGSDGHDRNGSEGEQALVLWYDSLDLTGHVRYQNALAPDNKAAFDACDGLFTNYWWGVPQLAQSAALAGGVRQCDVYVGVDCFARNTPYAAGPACAPACAAARAAGPSLGSDF